MALFYTSDGTDDELVRTGSAYLVGVNVTENDAGTAEIKVFDGEDGTGRLMFRLVLTQNESRGEFFGEPGVRAQEGIFLERVSGDTEVVLYLN